MNRAEAPVLDLGDGASHASRGASLWIDLDVGPFMRGLGDALTLAWLAEGLGSDPILSAGEARAERKMGLTPSVGQRRRIAFRTSGPRLELLKLFGQEAYNREEQPEHLPPPIAVSDAYQAELDDAGQKLRIEYLAEHLGLPAVWARPEVRGQTSDLRSPISVLRPQTLLFPQTHWPTRAWPACYWVDLAWQLHAAGHAVSLLLERPDSRYKSVPHWKSGLPLVELIETVERAGLVIGNDSFGIHLAATLGVPTIALFGPTKPRCVLGHMAAGPGGEKLPGAAPLAGLVDETLPCAPCHFSAGAGFRAACDQGCLALHRLHPEKVLYLALQLARGSREP